MLRKALVLAILLGPVLSATDSVEAQKTDRRFEGRVEVTEVLLDVVVTDRAGSVIAGLDKADFVVVENGRRVEPTAATFYTTRYSQDGPSVASNEVPGSRYFIFFFHDQRYLGGIGSRLVQQQLQAGRRSREWIETEMGPSDWIAVVSYDFKLKIHQDFTQDRTLLLEAIDSGARSVDPEKGRPLRREIGDHTEASLLRRLPSGIDLRRQTKRIYDGMRLLAEASGHIVGRKNLLLFSIGFGEFFNGPIPLPDPRYYPALEEALNANNVAVYSIDLTPHNTEHLQSHFLNTLANDTGGAYYELFTNFLTPLRRIASESTGYYLLSYRVEYPAGESGYRKVKIQMRDKRLRAKAQRGYRYGEENTARP